ncbi:outer membrane autotransporter barrel domain-containing protein [Ancylobacter defluvii]|uniref:Outer membrane autotransporter barrel domain-containing protein n=1 Tax=Ancylobacter defluvii TaxID=1282440 RepID=A0A9W6K0H0_9HYPH|nr:outer membrane autotransporter barrel domain-containing protein [Ancylobacter defluvii]
MALIGLSVPIALAQSVSGSGDVSPTVPSPPLPAWDAGPVLSVGIDDVGSIAVEDGGQLVSSVGAPGFVGTYIGRNVDGMGTVVVSGADAGGTASTWENAGFLSAGYSGDGSVRVEEGGRITSLWARLGTNVGSTGSVTVSGTDAAGNASRWETGPIMVGRAGAGVLAIEGGGQVAVDGSWSLLGWLPGASGTMSVSGAGSSFTGTETFRVGYQGTGALEITDGGLMETGETKIGFRAGSTGSAVVSGTDPLGSASRWENAQALVVGSQGIGTLTISDGGQVTSAEGYIGEGASGVGAVTISGGDPSGAPSEWTNAGFLSVGAAATGSLTIENGGRLTSSFAPLDFVGTYIGEHADGVGSVTVSGADAAGQVSSWENSGFLSVGHLGTGTLAVTDGGRVTSAWARIGTTAGGVGSVTVSDVGVDGTASLWESGPVVVGDRGIGSLTIEHGGRMEVTPSSTQIPMTIGRSAGATGAVTVAGTGPDGDPSLLRSTQTIGLNVYTAEILVGEAGDGSLTVRDGGRVEGGITAGFRRQSTGTVIVSGTDAFGTPSTIDGRAAPDDGLGSWTSIGNQGTGTLIIENGGQVINGYMAQLGLQGTGTVAVSGTDARGRASLWESDNIYVGGKGDAGMTITGGGRIASHRARIGQGNHSTGSVVVSGTDAAGNPSIWSITEETDYPGPYGGDLMLGSNTYGFGSLRIEAGGRVEDIYGIIGGYGAGEVTVTGTSAAGTPSTWFNSDRLVVGYQRQGALTIEDGGEVVSSNGFIGGYHDARNGADSTGQVIISGANSQGMASRWRTNYVAVGNYGDGTVDIQAGGRLEAHAASIGVEAGGNGQVKVSGTAQNGRASTLHAARNLVVGDAGRGALLIEDGGAVLLDFESPMVIGAQPGSSGYVVVSGTDSAGNPSSLSATYGGFPINVGRDGRGELVIEEGAIVYTARSDIGGVDGSSVTVTGRSDDGTPSRWITDELRVAGKLVIEDGGVLETQGSTSIEGIEGVEATVRFDEGAEWLAFGRVMVGGAGAGALIVDDGLVGISGDLFVSQHNSVSPNNGTVYVTGKDGTVSADRLGVGAKGQVTVTDGGGVYISHSVEIGQGGSSGTANVIVSGRSENKSSMLNAGSEFWVGSTRPGELRIEDGGYAWGTEDLAIIGGYAAGAVTVSGVHADGTRSAWDVQDLYVSGHGAGSLLIEKGGKVSSTLGVLSNDAIVESTDPDVPVNDPTNAGPATVVIAGTDGSGGNASTWWAGERLSIGDTGSGTLTVSDSGALRVMPEWDPETTPGIIRLGRAAGSSGTLNIGAAANAAAVAPGEVEASSLDFGRGAGTLVFNHTSYDYAFAPALNSVGAGSHRIEQRAGVTRLTGDGSQFAGTTVVSGGTLVVEGALSGGALLTNGRLVVDGNLNGDVSMGSWISDGGGLAGRGTVAGDVVFGEGNVLSGRQGQTLAITGDAVLQQYSYIDVSLGGPSGTPLFDVGGDVTLDGYLDIYDLGGFGAGVYRLFDYGGTLTDNLLEFGRVPLEVGLNQVSIQTSVAHQVNLVASGDYPMAFWDGGVAAQHGNGMVNGGAGIWSANRPNWTNAEGTTTGPYPNPSFAVFQGAPGTVTVDNAQGAIGVTGMQFASDGYRIEGDPIALAAPGYEPIIRVGDGTEAGRAMTAIIASNLTGDVNLVKTDLGTLVLSGMNTYTAGTFVEGGTVSVSSDANLGAPSAIVLLRQGVLATTADMSSNREIAVGPLSAIDVLSATTLTLGGEVLGKDLRKTGGGTLSLTGSRHRYTGVIVEEGTLIGDATTIRGDIRNAGTVVFNQGANAAFAGDIEGYEGVRGEMVKRRPGALTLTGSSYLDWSLENGALSTSASRFTGGVAIGPTATLNFSEDERDATYAGRISGSGVLNKRGGYTLTYNGDGADFSGLTRIEAGMLSVGQSRSWRDVVLGGSFDIWAGATLTGYGTVGSGGNSTVTVRDGATLGTDLTVDADVILQDGATLAMVQPGEDRALKVAGSATLESGARLAVEASDVSPRGSYTLLAAEGGLTGRFDEVQADFAFLDTEVAYDYAAGTVALEVARNDIDFASTAATPTQAATAEAVESLGLAAENPLYDAVALLPNDLSAIRSGFDQLSGEIHASAQSVLMQNSHFLRDAVAGRLRAAFGGVAAPTSPVMAYDGGAVKALPADTERGAFWAYGFGSWGSFAGTDNAASVNNDVGGVFMGADAQVLESWRLGVMAGYSSASFDIDDRSSSGDGADWHVGLYGGTQQGPVGVRLGLAYTWSEIETARAVAIPGFSDQLNGDYDAGAFQAFGDVGYRLDVGTASFEPFAGLAYVSIDTDGFTEQGGAAALSAAGQDMETTFTTLGLRASTTMAFGTGEVVLSGALGWRHAFGDVVPASTLAFAGSDNFTVAGVPIAEDAAVVEAGLDVNLSEAATLGLAYQGQFGDGVTQNGFNATLSVRF